MNKTKRVLFGLFFFCGFFVTVAAFAAETMDSVLQKVEQAPWGEKQPALKKKLGISPLFTNKTILITDGAELSSRSTLNYLFKEKTGGFYNLAWYTATPVSDMKSALSLAKTIERALGKKYGKPKISHTSGKPGEAKNIAKKMENRKKVLEILNKTEAGKGSKLNLEETSKALTAEGLSIEDMMPTLFYSQLHFWDAKDLWIVSNLLCSNDGTCYQHLQFVSKELTKDESYQPTPKELFSYTPLDRDQDAVTKFNRTFSRQ